MGNTPRNFRKFQKIPLILSLTFTLVSIFAFLFLYKQISDNIKIAARAQVEWQDETSRRDELKSLDRLMKVIGEEKTLLEMHFAQNSNIVPFLDTIEKLALSVKAKSEVVAVDIPKDKSGLQIDVKASGSFEAVYKFLMLLENSPYELDFISVNIQRVSEQTTSDKKVVAPQWDAIFKIKLLSFIQQVAI